MKRTVLRAAVILVGLLVLLPAHAAARSLYGVPPDAWQRKALTLAANTWHPACGRLTISFETTAPVGGDAWGAWAYAGDCAIHIPAQIAWMGYPEFCQFVLHEAGHVAGRGHSRSGVMRAEQSIMRVDNFHHGRHWTVWIGVDRRCLT